MPSSIANFSDNVRFLRPKIEVDLAKNGTWVDYTDYLDNFSIYETTHGNVCGIFDTICDVVLIIPNAGLEWVARGRPVRISVSISNDNWATNYSKVLFFGTTSAKNTLPETYVRIQATNLNSDYLEKRVQRQVFLQQDIASIMTSLLQQVGVPSGKINLTTTGVIIDAFVVNDNQPIKVFIEELAKANLMTVGFNKEGVFVSRFLLKLNASGSQPTPEASVTLSQTKSFKEREIRSSFYANNVKIEGRQVKYLQNQTLYYNNQLVGYEILPNSKLFFTLEIPGLELIEVLPFTPRRTDDFASIFYFTPVYSYFDFQESDDGVGVSNNSNIRVVSASIAEKDEKDVLLLIWENMHQSQSFFLKSILVNGSGVLTTGNIKAINIDQQAIQHDGGESVFEITSKAIQSDVVANNLTSLLILNLSTYIDVFTLEIAGRPELELGSVVQIQTKDGQNITGSIFDIDTVLSGDDGYLQTITVKELPPLVNYFRWDVSNVAWDSTTYRFF